MEEQISSQDVAPPSISPSAVPQTSVGESNITLFKALDHLPSPSSPAWHSAIFLGGTCANTLRMSLSAANTTKNWRDRLLNHLRSALDHPTAVRGNNSGSISVFNPERTDWDETWVESPQDRRFAEQVAWELTAQRRCHMLVFYFEAEAKGTVSLLELGMALGRKDSSSSSWRAGKEIFVCCEPAYWKMGNVCLACDEVGVNVHSTYEEMVGALVEYLRQVASAPGEG